MTDKERIEKLISALIAARYSLAWWAYNPAYSMKRERALTDELRRYDAVIEATSLNTEQRQ